MKEQLTTPEQQQESLKDIAEKAEDFAKKLGSIQEALDFIKGFKDGIQLSERQVASLQEYTGDGSNNDHMSLLLNGLKRKLSEKLPELAGTFTDEEFEKVDLGPYGTKQKETEAEEKQPKVTIIDDESFMDNLDEKPASFMDDAEEDFPVPEDGKFDSESMQDIVAQEKAKASSFMNEEMQRESFMNNNNEQSGDLSPESIDERSADEKRLDELDSVFNATFDYPPNDAEIQSFIQANNLDYNDLDLPMMEAIQERLRAKGLDENLPRLPYGSMEDIDDNTRQEVRQAYFKKYLQSIKQEKPLTIQEQKAKQLDVNEVQAAIEELQNEKFQPKKRGEFTQEQIQDSIAQARKDLEERQRRDAA